MMPNMDGHHALYLYIVQIRYEIRVLNSQCLKFTLRQNCKRIINFGVKIQISNIFLKFSPKSNLFEAQVHFVYFMIWRAQAN